MTKQPDKSERALQLREQGLLPAQIAERLGTTPKNAANLINNAKARRAKETAGTVAEMEGR